MAYAPHRIAYLLAAARVADTTDHGYDTLFNSCDHQFLILGVDTLRGQAWDVLGVDAR